MGQSPSIGCVDWRAHIKETPPLAARLKPAIHRMQLRAFTVYYSGPLIRQNVGPDRTWYEVVLYAAMESWSWWYLIMYSYHLILFADSISAASSPSYILLDFLKPVDIQIWKSNKIVTTLVQVLLHWFRFYYIGSGFTTLVQVLLHWFRFYFIGSGFTTLVQVLQAWEKAEGKVFLKAIQMFSPVNNGLVV